MERRRRTPRSAATSPPPPAPPDPSSSLLRDVSNYETPRQHFRNPNSIPPSPSPISIFFTASKKTPSSAAFLRPASAARRLKALELDQSRSSRKAQIRRDRDLQSFSKSISAWLNFLFENPRSCGCEIGGFHQESLSLLRGKRESFDGGVGIGDGGRWRSPKKQRKVSKRFDGEEQSSLSSARLSSLRASLKDVCSLEDMRERLDQYMSRKSCNEVLSMMSQICKNIDDGRLKMKESCPIVTDLRLKEKAIKVLMLYNPAWLRIGLHIVLGGDSLSLNEGQSDQDPFLKIIIEKQFFSHNVLAKSYAYNKLVEGLYRPGYFEALGNIVLKRFLLFVISLDKAKCESTLPIKYGIDGLDGGSPLMFSRHSYIKSSQKVIHELLSEVMLGEGDLLAHLVTVGCKVNYQQSPLAEYDFRVLNLFEDLQDGLLLCRAIQLLQCDASILSKVTAPSDTRKKNMHTCTIALQYLKQADVPLSDCDGVLIVAEDIVNGDKELTLSILWNMFLHLQVPLLINKALLVEEIIRIKESDVDLSVYNTMTHMLLLLEWIQVACKESPIKVDSFSSLIDGKAFHFLINYYLCIEVTNGHTEDMIKSFDNNPTVDINGFSLVRNVTAILGKFPEVFPVSDILNQDPYYDDRSVIILVVYLASQLIHRKNSGLLTAFKVTRSDYQSPDMKSSSVRLTRPSGYVFPNHSGGTSKLRLSSPMIKKKLQKHSAEDLAATVIQTRFRRFTLRNKFIKIKTATSFLQTVTRAWLVVRLKTKSNNVDAACSFPHQFYENAIASDVFERYLKLMTERQKFLKTKKAVLCIQQAAGSWLKRRHYKHYVKAVSYLQAHIRGHIVRHILITQLQKRREHQNRFAIMIQLAWRSFTEHKFHSQKMCSAIKIQSLWRGWYTRKNFFLEIGAIIKIQASIRNHIYQKAFERRKFAAIDIQCFIRGQIALSRMLHFHLPSPKVSNTGHPSKSGDHHSDVRNGDSSSKAKNISNHQKLAGRIPFGSYGDINIIQSDFPDHRVLYSVSKLQRWWKLVLLCKYKTMSAILIQSSIRGWIAQRAANKRRRSIIIIQRRWRFFLFLQSRHGSILIIQSHFRGWSARRQARQDKHHISIIQAYWKGYLVRKASKQQVVDLRYRLEKSASNAKDDMRLINRLVAALSELLGCRSVRNIRHTCATLNMATEHSHKCCETLVDAGAIGILLKQFHSLNRGIPDQEVLKHVLCTLRNIIHYEHLNHALIDTPHSMEIIFQEVLRNKSGFFIACEIMKKLCTIQEGFKAVNRLQGHVKRLRSLAQDLQRKAEMQNKRNTQLVAAREDIICRLKETLDLLALLDGR